MSDIEVLSADRLKVDGIIYRCTVGERGFADHHTEGGRTTPKGIFPLRACLYRADRLQAPQTLLPVTALAPDDGWCDAPEDPAYNRPVKLPYRASCETLFRDDSIYDIIVPIGYNDDPVVKGRGSAIFFHLTTDYRQTSGCVAVTLPDMLVISAKLSKTSRIIIAPEA